MSHPEHVSNLNSQQAAIKGHWCSFVQLHSITGRDSDRPKLQKGRLLSPYKAAAVPDTAETWWTGAWPGIESKQALTQRCPLGQWPEWWMLH